MEPSKRSFLPEDFVRVLKGASDDVVVPVRPSLSFGRETTGRLMHNKVAVLCVAVLLLLALGAIFIPFFSPFDFATQNVAFANKPFFSTNPATGLTHIFGTDNLGRDIFVRIWYGARVSFLVAVAAAVIDGLIGVVYGSISGYFGGRVDNLMMRILEVISGVPYLVVVILLTAVLPRGIGTLILAYTIVGWTGTARLIRGQVLSLSSREFMVAARIMGAGMGRIVFKHLVPNTMGIIIVNMTLDIPGIIFTEAFLSLLGLGVPAPYPSLGVMANEGVAVFQTYPARLAVPALIICLTMLAFNILGDQIQDTLNPKLRGGAGFGKRTDD